MDDCESDRFVHSKVNGENKIFGVLQNMTYPGTLTSVTQGTTLSITVMSDYGCQKHCLMLMTVTQIKQMFC